MFLSVTTSTLFAPIFRQMIPVWAREPKPSVCSGSGRGTSRITSPGSYRIAFLKRKKCTAFSAFQYHRFPPKALQSSAGPCFGRFCGQPSVLSAGTLKSTSVRKSMHILICSSVSDWFAALGLGVMVNSMKYPL